MLKVDNIIPLWIPQMSNKRLQTEEKGVKAPQKARRQSKMTKTPISNVEQRTPKRTRSQGSSIQTQKESSLD